MNSKDWRKHMEINDNNIIDNIIESNPRFNEYFDKVK